MTSLRTGDVVRIGDDLVLRRASPADADKLAEFNGRIHGDDEFDARGVAEWTRDLLTKPHPTFRPEDFTIVEKRDTGEVVSSLNLISQVWQYEGIPFKVGRPELVGTDPAYRSRGLVRMQFDLIHQWSCERGELVQAITGIPYFYRQFGYEMGLELSGGRMGYERHLPKLKEGEEEPYRIRPAVEADIPFLMRMAERETQFFMLNACRDEATWRDDLSGKSPENVNRWEVRIIETAAGGQPAAERQPAAEGQPVGYFAMPWYAWGGGTMQVLTHYMLAEDVSYLAVNPVVMRYLWAEGQKNAAARGKTLDRFGFWLGSDHPAYHAAAGHLGPQNPPYAFYVRVPELPAFLRAIAPALEKRLHASPCAGHTGELKLSFYRSGVRLAFESGRLVTAEAWKPRIHDDEGDASFPDLTFLHLLFGNLSLDDLRTVYVDAFANDEAKVLLAALFPKKPSAVWAIS